jgi:hypothetical protein
MKNLSSIIFKLILFSLLSFTVNANEVGNNIFVAKPIAQPIYVTKLGSKYYPCTGFINKKLIPIIYNELKALSNNYKVLPPSADYCLYKIGKLNLGSTILTTYNVEMYVNKASMMSCVYKDYCTDTRMMMFKLKNKKLHRQYMITNLNKKLTKFMCISHAGKIVNVRGSC